MSSWLQQILETMGMSSPARDASASQSLEKLEVLLQDVSIHEREFTAGVALLLGRVAYADTHVSAGEEGKMEVLLENHLGLPKENAQAVAHLAIALTERGHGENHLVLRTLNHQTNLAQKRGILRMLLSLASDDEISQVEDMEVRKVADAFGFSHREYMDLRAEYRDALSVLKKR